MNSKRRIRTRFPNPAGPTRKAQKTLTNAPGRSVRNYKLLQMGAYFNVTLPPRTGRNYLIQRNLDVNSLCLSITPTNSSRPERCTSRGESNGTVHSSNLALTRTGKGRNGPPQ